MQEIANRNGANHHKQEIPHAGGTKSFSRYRKELTIDGCPPNPIEMFRHLHTKNRGKGQPINKKAAVILSKFDKWSANQDSTSVSAEEFFMQTMGPEWHGRVRGYGLGPTPSSIFGSSFRQETSGTYSQVCNRLTNVLDEMEHMKATMTQHIIEEREKRVQLQEEMHQYMQRF